MPATLKRQRRKHDSRSAQIRSAFKQLGRGARPRAVVEHLKAQGVEVSSSLVSQVRRKHPTVSNGHARPRALDIEQLVSVKGVVARVGSIGEVRRLLDALEKLT